MESGIPDNDPSLAIQQGLAAIEKQRGPLDFGTYSVGALAEVDSYLFSARGPDGKEISGILFRPRARPDMMFAVTAMAPIGRETVQRINDRLPPPLPPSAKPAAKPPRQWAPEPILPPTPGQRGAPAELLSQGQALADDAARRRAAMFGPQGQPVMAPGSVPIEAPVAMPVVLPRATQPARVNPAQLPDIPPDLDEGGVEQG